MQKLVTGTPTKRDFSPLYAIDSIRRAIVVGKLEFTREAVQVKATATAVGAGERLHEMDPQRVAMIEDQMRSSAHYHYDGSTEWAALLRKLERTCPDYRT